MLDLLLPGTAYLEVVPLAESNEIEKSIFSCKIRYEPPRMALKALKPRNDRRRQVKQFPYKKN